MPIAAVFHEGNTLALDSVAQNELGLAVFRRTKLVERIDYLLHIVAVYGHAFEAERFKLFRKIQHRHDLITGSVDLKVIVIAEHYDVIQLIFVAYLSSFPDLAFLTLAVAYDDKHFFMSGCP